MGDFWCGKAEEDKGSTEQERSEKAASKSPKKARGGKCQTATMQTRARHNAAAAAARLTPQSPAQPFSSSIHRIFTVTVRNPPEVAEPYLRQHDGTFAKTEKLDASHHSLSGKPENGPGSPFRVPFPVWWGGSELRERQSVGGGWKGRGQRPAHPDPSGQQRHRRPARGGAWRGGGGSGGRLRLGGLVRVGDDDHVRGAPAANPGPRLEAEPWGPLRPMGAGVGLWAER